jgi:cell division protein FtsW (lipid II flippase)
LLFTPLWITLNWAKWWLYIKWLWTVQPAEFFKIWFVIFFSWWLIKKKKEKAFDKPYWILVIVMMTLLFFIEFVFIRDWWTLLIMFPIVLIMFWYITWDWKKVIWIIWLYVLFWIIWLTLLWDFGYVKQRIAYYIDSDIDISWKWVWWQTEQSLISIGWWWFFWKWYGNWLQKFWNLPEAQSDFIFAAFSEEIGFFGNMFLLSLYFWLAYYFLQRLIYEKDDYYKNLWIWLISLIIIQVFVHIWVNTKLLPLTWLTLPFVSVGGTALMINLIEVTLLYKIYKNAWKNITDINPFKVRFKTKHRKSF